MVGLIETQMRRSVAADEEYMDTARGVAEPAITATGNAPDQQADIHNHLHKIVQTIAQLKIDILLQGETGTGKDTLARRIYQLTPQSVLLMGQRITAISSALSRCRRVRRTPCSPVFSAMTAR
ncbi:sigma 54-interacting transcriptional regulator [Erwinia sp. V71]|uniref:sigma 54-interacting transcriptional regulator n=1 Tax=Erwinia sp. V71 TaxID=3369424 RepID=UPI003F60D273